MDIKDYKNVYVFAEQRDGAIQSVAYELLGKARDLADALGEKVVAMLLGYQIKDQASKLLEMGADEVIVADCPELKDYLTEEYSQVVYRLIQENKPNIVLYGATTIGRENSPSATMRPPRTSTSRPSSAGRGIAPSANEANAISDSSAAQTCARSSSGGSTSQSFASDPVVTSASPSASAASAGISTEAYR